MTPLLRSEIAACLRRALEEDVGSGDVTTEAIVPAAAMLRGQIVAKQAGVIAGLNVAEEVLNQITLEDTLESLQKHRYVIDIPEDIRSRAARAVERMIKIG